MSVMIFDDGNSIIKASLAAFARNC